MRTRDPRSLLPLTPIVFHVLLALADEPRHGYGILTDVDDRTDGVIALRTGTLYVLLQRLSDERLIEQVTPPRGAAPARTPGSPRRYYTLTTFGRAVLAAEARRLEAALGDARRRRVLREKA